MQHSRTRKNTARTLQPWTIRSEPMALGPWPTTLGPWPLALDPWPLALGPWPLDLVDKCKTKRHSHRKRRVLNVTLENARVLRSPYKHLTALPDRPYEALLQSTLPCTN